MESGGENADIGSKPKVLLCLSGSVAVIKVPQLAMMLSEFAEVGTSNKVVKAVFCWKSVECGA